RRASDNSRTRSRTAMRRMIAHQWEFASKSSIVIDVSYSRWYTDRYWDFASEYGGCHGIPNPGPNQHLPVLDVETQAPSSLRPSHPRCLLPCYHRSPVDQAGLYP